MKLNEREKKLLMLLAVVATVFLVAYLILPQIRRINSLKTEISTTEIQVSTNETRREVLNSKYVEKQSELDKIKTELGDSRSHFGEVKLYKSITNGEIIVELNKFVPVSPTDKFIFEEIEFIENQADENATTEEGATTETEESEAKETENTKEDNSTQGSTSEMDGAQSIAEAQSIEQAQNMESALEAGNIDEVFGEYGFEQNLTTVKFTGYYSSLVKFVGNLNSNENYVVLLSLSIENVALNDPTVAENLISGQMLIAFPTYEGASDVTDIYSIIEGIYEQSTSDPFGPYDGFVINDESSDYENNAGGDGSNLTGEEQVVFKTIESFNKNKFFFVTNDARNGGYTSTSQKGTDGNPSLKLYYDFYNRNNKNIAYAVSESENIVLDSTPQEILIDVFNDSSNENQFGVVFRDATGNESEAIILDNLDFNGWSTCTIPLPDNMVYPVVVQRFYVKSGGSGIKQEGTILLDNLRIVEY